MYENLAIPIYHYLYNELNLKAKKCTFLLHSPSKQVEKVRARLFWALSIVLPEPESAKDASLMPSTRLFTYQTWLLPINNSVTVHHWEKKLEPLFSEVPEAGHVLDWKPLALPLESSV